MHKDLRKKGGTLVVNTSNTVVLVVQSQSGRRIKQFSLTFGYLFPSFTVGPSP